MTPPGCLKLQAEAGYGPAAARAEARAEIPELGAEDLLYGFNK